MPAFSLVLTLGTDRKIISDFVFYHFSCIGLFIRDPLPDPVIRHTEHRAFFVLAPLHVVFGIRKKIISFRENFWPGKPSKTVISPISETMKNGRKALYDKTFRGFQNVKAFLEAVC